MAKPLSSALYVPTEYVFVSDSITNRLKNNLSKVQYK
jgi:hypothetical protein